MKISDLNPQTARLLYRDESELGQLSVYENELYRWLSFDNQQAHSAMLPGLPHKMVLPYYPVLLSSLLFQPKPESVLMIGLGGGDLLRFYHHYLPHSQLLVIELSAPVITAFKNHFFTADLLPDHIDVQMGDVCEYMRINNDSVFDTIYIDVYGEDSLPKCFYELAFYRGLSRRISARGVVAVNFVVRDEQDALQLMRLMYEGFEQHILCLSVDGYMNLVVLGFRQNPLSLNHRDMDARIEGLAEQFEMDFSTLVKNLIQNNPHLATQIEDYFAQA